MSSKDILMGAAGSGEPVYVEDVFSTYTYTGLGKHRPINNGIPLGSSAAITVNRFFGAENWYDSIEYKPSSTRTYQVITTRASSLVFVRLDSGVKTYEKTFTTGLYGLDNIRCVLESGNYCYICGSVVTSSNFGTREGLVFKLNSSDGTIVWQKRYNLNSYGNCNDIKLSGGFIYVAADGGTGSSSDAVLMKINDSDGTLVTSKFLHYYVDHNYGSNVLFDGSGNIYLYGYTDASGSWTKFVAKFDSSLTLQWVKEVYGGGTSGGACTDGTNIYTVSAYGSNIVVSSISTSGVLNWQKYASFSPYTIYTSNSNCTIKNGILYFGGWTTNMNPYFTGYFAAIDTTTQNIIFQKNINSDSYHTNLKFFNVVGNNIYFTASDTNSSVVQNGYSILFDGTDISGRISDLSVYNEGRSYNNSGQPITASSLTVTTIGLTVGDPLISVSNTSAATNTQYYNKSVSGSNGLVVLKERTRASSTTWVDTVRGKNSFLYTNSFNAAATGYAPYYDLSSFDANGFTLGVSAMTGSNENGYGYVSWTFKQQPKFFDIVSYTGTGSARTIQHNLGSVPGCIIVKCTSTGYTDWRVYHNSLSGPSYTVQLNSTAAESNQPSIWNSTNPTPSVFSVGADPSVNNLGDTYVAYLFAHQSGGFGKSGTDSIISCGILSFPGSDSEVYLGWEPQWVMFKPTSGPGAGTNHWMIIDSMREFSDSGDAYLQPNNVSGEVLHYSGTDPGSFLVPTPTGFKCRAGFYGGYTAGIYIAIRRPMKTPTSGDSVFKPITYTGTGAARSITNIGWSPDLLISGSRYQYYGFACWDRLRGITNYANRVLMLGGNSYVEQTGGQSDIASFDSLGVSYGDAAGWYYANQAMQTYIEYFFKRAPGFFDIALVKQTVPGYPYQCQSFTHGLGVVPELIISKNRSMSMTNWCVSAYNAMGSNQIMYINSYYPKMASGTSGGIPTPTTTTAGFPADGSSGHNYVVYLFASCPGVSKIGSYAGNGTTQTINCGFSSGARFILIKRTDSNAEWYVWDTARGIVAGNDPFQSFGASSPEIGIYDPIDPDLTGFIVNENSGSNINSSGATYLYLAIA